MRFSPSMTSRGSRARTLSWLLALSMTLPPALSACSSAPPLEITTAPARIERPQVQPLPDPDDLKLQAVKWGVAKPDAPPPDVVFTLTPEMYEDLARNWAEVLRWIMEARHRLDYYREQLSKEGAGDGRGD